MEKFNIQVNAVLLALQTKLADSFGSTTVDRKTVLQLAKELGYLQGKRGREGGTFATEMGMSFANLSGDIIKPVLKASKSPKFDAAFQPVPQVAAEVTLSEVS